MLEEVLQYVHSRGPEQLGRDALDILITYYIFYRIALVLRGTRAIQVVFGLVFVFMLYLVAQLLQLDTVLTLLSAVLSSAILIGVVVFQNDIRRGLMRVGARARFGSTQSLEGRVVEQVVDAATTLARHRTGAIITFEQDANLDEFVGSHTGHLVDAAVSSELLVSLFVPDAMNAMHDGAVIIRDLRVAKAGVFFPMPQGRVSDESFGSRHRAAMGITEETDAVVVVVSEERGSISFCFNGNIVPNLDGPRLKAALEGVFVSKHARTQTRPHSLWARLRNRNAGETPAPTTVTVKAVLAEAEPAPESTKQAPVVETKADETPQPLRKLKPKEGGEEERVTEQPEEKKEAPKSAPEPLRKRRPKEEPKATDDKGEQRADTQGDKTETPKPAPEPLRKRKPATESTDTKRPSAPPPSLRGQALAEAQQAAVGDRESKADPPRPMPPAAPIDGGGSSQKALTRDTMPPASTKRHDSTPPPSAPQPEVVPMPRSEQLPTPRAKGGEST
jgi:uncharacterized protein (TIGR00159 family)